MPETHPNSSAATLTEAARNSNPNCKILFGKYELGRLLGCGGFAKVYHARDVTTGKSVAVKAVSKRKVASGSGTAKTADFEAHVKREVSIMRRLRHPHIIRLLEVLATRSKVYFIMDFAKGGELFAKVAKGRFSEDLSRRYFRQLISAVGYCHSRGVFHRDLKPENILLDENWSLKVSDFGLSAVKEQQNREGMLHTLCGTPAYVAPEILAKKGYDGEKIDVWSCGIILFVLTAGYLPFNDPNLMNLYRKIYKGEFRFPRWMSPDLRRLLSRLLDTNPDTRITIEGIMNDPWFKNGESDLNFHDLKINDDRKETDCGNVDESGSRYLNAFDLITFSPGFNLSRMFDKAEENDKEAFLTAEKAEVVVEKVESSARGIHVPAVVVERVKGGMGVSVEGQDGNFGVVVEVYRLTEEITVVEVRKREKDVGPSHDFWRDKLKPRISHLFCNNQPGRPGSQPGSS